MHYDDIGTDRGEWLLKRFDASSRMLAGAEGYCPCGFIGSVERVESRQISADARWQA